MAHNIPTLFYDTDVVVERVTEVPFADFRGGMNQGGSCAGGIGVNTGDYDPKSQDWQGDPVGANRDYLRSGYIGIDSGGNDLVNMWREDGDHLLDFVGFGYNNTPGEVAPGGALDSFLVLINETGKSIPENSFAWAPNIQTVGDAAGSIIENNGTQLSPAIVELTGDWSGGDVDADITGTSDNGTWDIGGGGALPGPTSRDAAFQLATLITELNPNVLATPVNARVLIQPRGDTTTLQVTTFTVTLPPP